MADYEALPMTEEWLRWHPYAPDWDDEARRRYQADYAADQPVLMPHAEHWPGECGHCDLLRRLQREVEDRSG